MLRARLFITMRILIFHQPIVLREHICKFADAYCQSLGLLWLDVKVDRQKKKQRQQQRTNKHISLITLSSLYPKKKSRTGLRYFQILIIIFYIRAIAGDPFQKTEPTPGFAVGMLGSPKSNFKANSMVYIVYYRVVKSMFFFSFAYKALPTMSTTNRNTEVSRVVSGDSQQKHILRIIDARTRPQLNNLQNGNLD